MQILTLIALTAILTIPYLASIGVAPSNAKFIPEAFSAVIAVYVLAAGIATGFKFVRKEYWIAFTAAVVIITCGIIANSVEPGPILSGMRYYLRALPFFFLPIIFRYTDSDIKQQLRLLCGIALLQLPLAGYQKYILVQDQRTTGDFVFGTLMLSSSLTIFLIMGICFILALLLKQRLSKPLFLALFIAFLIPTTLNETKVTIFFFPLAVLATAMVGAKPGRKLRILGLATMLLLTAGAIFVPIFDYLGGQNLPVGEKGSRISDMFTEKDFLDRYLNQNSDVGDEKPVGRVDALRVPVKVVSRQVVTLAFGLGLGNASNSNLGPQFSGKHSVLLAKYASGGSSAGSMVLEVGFLGMLCAMLLHWLIFQDSFRVARSSSSVIDALAAAWPAAVILITLSFFYVAPITSENMSYLFWYFSGLFAARRMQIADETARATPRRRIMAHQRVSAAAGSDTAANFYKH